MTESTHARLPMHLRRYVVEQNYSRYTPEDQAVWRFIMRQLKEFLSKHAHESYLSGLEKSGISVDKIPDINVIDEHLEKFGWGAVPVSGFIPPAAFMEFQSIGILPIASDMRTVNHLLYTPAPDIVHEAAGHAPILTNTEYSQYLRQYGEVARNSIISKEDMDQYEAIRLLSDIKEDPRSSAADIAKAEKRLGEVNRALSNVSEAALLSRMNWWTAEYGLIGAMTSPKIFGAGLLSSVGEAQECLSDKVKKIPLTVDCVNVSYDITEPQPQLFVARDFAHLGEVLEDLAQRMSYRRGGIFGLDRAIEARTVNTVQLDSGLQISGILKNYLTSETRDHSPIYLQFEGPSQLAVAGHELPNQGTSRHPQGFGSPLGPLRLHRRALSTYSESDLRNLALTPGERARLEFESGVKVEGILKDWTYKNDKLVILTWTDCRVSLNDKILFDPAWGEYDMAVGSEVTSVFGGPADRSRFGDTEDFVAKRVPPRTFSNEEKQRFALFADLRELREGGNVTLAKWQKLAKKYLSESDPAWLAGIELVELAHQNQLPEEERLEVEAQLNKVTDPTQKFCIKDGLKVAGRRL